MGIRLENPHTRSHGHHRWGHHLLEASNLLVKGDFRAFRVCNDLASELLESFAKHEQTQICKKFHDISDDLSMSFCSMVCVWTNVFIADV